MIPFLAIHAKGGESKSPKQKDRTTTYFLSAPPPIFFQQLKNSFKLESYCVQKGEKVAFQN
jgi:hypothetical protein